MKCSQYGLSVGLREDDFCKQVCATQTIDCALACDILPHTTLAASGLDLVNKQHVELWLLLRTKKLGRCRCVTTVGAGGGGRAALQKY